jgi:hypothetical protein
MLSLQPDYGDCFKVHFAVAHFSYSPLLSVYVTWWLSTADLRITCFSLRTSQNKQNRIEHPWKKTPMENRLLDQPRYTLGWLANPEKRRHKCQKHLLCNPRHTLRWLPRKTSKSKHQQISTLCNQKNLYCSCITVAQQSESQKYS